MTGLGHCINAKFGMWALHERVFPSPPVKQIVSLLPKKKKCRETQGPFGVVLLMFPVLCWAQILLGLSCAKVETYLKKLYQIVQISRAEVVW